MLVMPVTLCMLDPAGAFHVTRCLNFLIPAFHQCSTIPIILLSLVLKHQILIASEKLNVSKILFRKYNAFLP